MFRPAGALVAALLICVSFPVLASETAQVARVVDGDTLEVDISGRIEKVRLIGVDTPETVHPQKPVEIFGKEASEFTRRVAEGQIVQLEAEPAVGDRDRYDRLLRYVFLPDGRLLNAEIISQGYGHAYTRFPFSKMEEFRELERKAREAGLGLWGVAGEGGTPAEEPGGAGVAAAPRAPLSAPEAIASTETVYVTKSGTKYHRDGCRYLSKSKIPVTLADAAARYGPCSVCAPPIPSGTPVAGTTPSGTAGSSAAAPKVAPDAADPNETVYATKTGTKYHRAGCRYLAKSQIPIKLKDAVGRYGPCSVCAPPTLSPGATRQPSVTAQPPVAGGRCQAITRRGTRCKRSAAAGSRYCWQHGG